MDKRDALATMTAGMVLVVGAMGLVTCVLLYSEHAQFREEAVERMERLEVELKSIRENADRTRRQFLGRDGGVTEFGSEGLSGDGL